MSSIPSVKREAHTFNAGKGKREGDRERLVVDFSL